MNPRLLLSFTLVTASAFAQADKPALPDEKPTAEQLAFFESKIRPVLSDKCYKCHSEKSEKLRGGLLLDTRAGIRRGGDNGPAVVPGELRDSLLIDAIHYTNKDTAMPPEKSGGKLPDAVIADFEAWVKMGAPDPREGAAKVVKKYDTEEAKKWWSYQAPKKAEAPTVKDTAWPRGDIDRFILAGLEAKDIKPVGDTDKTSLLRRVYFDITGLPPALKEIDDFIKDTSADALAKVVDKLLASQQFGERWGRHWLDVARYAESSGKDVNIAYPHAWRYRDYVIAAFNEGKPFDQFVREQIAGDLLPAKDDREKAKNIVATGFLAIGAKGHNEQNPRQFYLDLADEQIDTMSQAFLGLTVACARCHDHKFEPIPQRDYYALAGIFLSTDTRWGTARGIQNRHTTDLIELPRGANAPVIERTMTKDERAKKQETFDTMHAELEKSIRERFQRGPGGGQANASAQDQQRFLRDATISGFLEADLKSFDENGRAKPLAMGAQDLPNTQAQGFGTFGMRRPGFGGGLYGAIRPPEFGSIADAHLYARGDVEKPTDRVPRGVPAVLSADTKLDIPNGTSGRRELAGWLVSKSNPLTARVFVNRTWHWLFGRGLVESCDNFGTTGKTPANQALLDTLAVQFMEKGWNVKALIREIVLSHAYALASAHDAKSFQADPENALVWHANKRRLEAECLRDAMLAASGDLYHGVRTGSLIADNGDGPIGGPRRPGGGGGFFGGMQPPGTGSDDIEESAGNYRSVYLPIARDVAPDSLTAFDFVDSTLVTGTRDATNVPGQALYLLNSEFVAEQSKLLAERVLKAYPAGPNAGASANLDPRATYAYWLVFNRQPDAAEKQAAATFFMKFPSNYAKGDKSAPGVKSDDAIKAAWTSFCRSLFAAAEFRYLN
jgi:hypothetical protein